MQETTTPKGTSMQRFRARYGLILEWVVMALMIALAVEVTLGVVFRAAGSSLVWYDEVASHLLAWLTFYGSALASVKRAHIGCPEIVDQLGAGTRRVLGIAVQVLVILFFVLLGWMGVAIMPALVGESLVSLPDVPMNVVQSALPISSALVVIAEITHLVDMLAARPAPGAAPGSALADGLH
jgi:TRAP-type C4-dicarboxylate transport system permease small subunit